MRLFIEPRVIPGVLNTPIIARYCDVIYRKMLFLSKMCTKFADVNKMYDTHDCFGICDLAVE